MEQLAQDLQAEFPGVSGFSASNLWRMRQFYQTYKDNEKLAPLVREIGWSHNVVIFEQCKDDLQREFYLRIAQLHHDDAYTPSLAGYPLGAIVTCLAGSSCLTQDLAPFGYPLGAAAGPELAEGLLTNLTPGESAFPSSTERVGVVVYYCCHAPTWTQSYEPSLIANDFRHPSSVSKTVSGEQVALIP